MRYKVKGFSLLEMLLVLAIMATTMVGILSYTIQKSDELRNDKTVMQIEQIFNAALAYYVSFGSWPRSTSELGGDFLPSTPIKNPWGLYFLVGQNSGGAGAGSQFYVCTQVKGRKAYASTMAIAGKLPLASAMGVSGSGTTCPPSTVTQCTTNNNTCTVVSSITIPGQSLSNARSVNFAGLYHNGACVAAPSCPLNMTPTIFVTPVSVSGMNDNNTTVYPISSFTAYATGGNTSTGLPAQDPYDCNNTTPTPCTLSYGPDVTSAQTPGATYWRVCIRIMTQKGLVTAPTSTTTGNATWAEDAGVILALTRCMPANEQTTPQASGSRFNVFMND